MQRKINKINVKKKERKKFEFVLVFTDVTNVPGVAGDACTGVGGDTVLTQAEITINAHTIVNVCHVDDRDRIETVLILTFVLKFMISNTLGFSQCPCSRD